MTNRIGLLAGAALAALVATGASAADVTLTFTRAGDSATVAKIFDPIIKAFEEANPGIAIESIPMGFDEANRRFPLMAATGQLPDVSLPPDSLAATLGQGGAFLDLEGKLSDELVADIPAGMWKFPCASDGKTRFGVPANAGALVLWYNVDVFRTAGLDPDNPPQTWDEFVAAAQAIEDKTDADGLGLNGFARNDVMDMFGAVTASRAGEWYWKDEGGVKTDAGVAEALDFVGKLVKDGLTQASVESYNRADTRALLRDGKVGMTFDGPWAIGVLKQNGDVAAADANYRTARLPGRDGPGATSLNVSCYNVSAATKHPDEAMKFIEFLSTPENMLAHAQGYGVVPVRKSVLESDAFAAQPWKALATATAADTVPAKPGVEELSLVEKTIPNAVQRVLLGQADGATALKDLADEEGWN